MTIILRCKISDLRLENEPQSSHNAIPFNKPVLYDQYTIYEGYIVNIGYRCYLEMRLLN